MRVVHYPLLVFLLSAVSPLAAQVTARRSFVLPSERAGNPYSAKLPGYREVITGFDQFPIQTPYVGFALGAGQSLPAGLLLDPATGLITGVTNDTGFHNVKILAFVSASDADEYSADIAIFTNPEQIVLNPPWLGGLDNIPPVSIADFPGIPYTYTFPCPNYAVCGIACQSPSPPPVPAPPGLRVYYPSSPPPGQLPVVIFHHGNGYCHDEYSKVLAFWANDGFICVTVDDPFVFSGFDFGPTYCFDDLQEGARIMIAAKQFLASSSQSILGPLYGTMDFDRVFYAGHSRGSACALIACELDPSARGVICMQGIDPRTSAWISPTQRQQILPLVPILLMSSEQDRDVTFPEPERLIERSLSPATAVCIYGGDHPYTSDNPVGCGSTPREPCIWSASDEQVDKCPYSKASVQRGWIKHFGLAFLRRHGKGDLSAENILYRPAYSRSVRVAVAYRRNLSSTRIIDRFDLAPPGAPYVSGSIYDAFGTTGQPDPPRPPVHNAIFALPPSGTVMLTEPINGGAAYDARKHKCVTFRVQNADDTRQYFRPDNFGWSWLDWSIEARDADGDIASVPLNDRVPSTPTYPSVDTTPQPTPPTVTMKYQRFISLQVSLAEFTQKNAAVDLSRLIEVRFKLRAVPPYSDAPIFALDDLQFE